MKLKHYLFVIANLITAPFFATNVDVTNTNDSGANSFREAIDSVNGFGAGVHSI
nr:hypothetical protein [Chlamydiota bacterium]